MVPVINYETEDNAGNKTLIIKWLSFVHAQAKRLEKDRKEEIMEAQTEKGRKRGKHNDGPEKNKEK